MGRKIKVDFTGLNGVGKKFNEKSIELAKIVEEMNETINSIDTCWRGADANNFKANTKNFLAYLSIESKYYESWSEYFGKRTKVFHSVIQDNKEGLQKVNNSFINDIKDGDLDVRI